MLMHECILTQSHILYHLEGQYLRLQLILLVVKWIFGYLLITVFLLQEKKYNCSRRLWLLIFGFTNHLVLDTGRYNRSKCLMEHVSQILFINKERRGIMECDFELIHPHTSAMYYLLIAFNMNYCIDTL